ncbi:MAG TPA: thiamine pyrophosphate-dependent enzyme [Thermoanaerobaculia bacterium]|nr:thiamine pyrophosphate-dependent enzyme [Thermoanaerobaculia bacterium]
MQTDRQGAAAPANAQFTKENILSDYRMGYRSRQASLIGRKEVLTGKAKFGIFGDGKEVGQLAMARAFRNGDFRSGYYRDQTFMFATGMATLDEFFGQLYASTELELDPASAGRSMNCHFGTRSLDENGEWKNLAGMMNSASDVSPTGSQMPRLVGLAYASKLYREVDELRSMTQFSRNGDEIAFGTIGNASCAEGMFWESINAIGVLQVPVVMSIWDDGFGISVPNEFQVTKGNISEILKGFQRDSRGQKGFDIYQVRGWDYPALCETYLNAASMVRTEHVPAIIHVIEVTQPQGHSTSGSHERYKSKERLQWEEDYCCLKMMRRWILEQGIATAEELDRYEDEDRRMVRDSQRRVWDAYRAPIDRERTELITLIDSVVAASANRARVTEIRNELQRTPNVFRRDLARAAASVLVAGREAGETALAPLAGWRNEYNRINDQRYDSDLLSSSGESSIRVPVVPAAFNAESPVMNGFEVLNACFDAALKKYPNLIAIGEDVGQLGDVNQGFAGLQAKYGLLRVSDTGIRECTIVGQAIGMAMRGLRPIAEIQYLDYILYAIQILSDDLATLRWRTKSGQKAPVIIRTRGHRLEGVWHSGSPMAGIISLLRGMQVCVPRNMTQAAGFYNTLLQSDDPAVVVEVLNAYRAKERRPVNIGEFTVPLGVPEILREGTDVTIVTYGACCRIAMEAAELLDETQISAEIIDVQTLLPFDLQGIIARSLQKTSRVVFLDEDVPGGASAYMMQQVLERDRAWELLDSEPRTVTAKEHRPAYGSDGDYYSKPGRESVFEAVYGLMNESDPRRYPKFY